MRKTIMPELLWLAGGATRSNNITASYVSPIQYQSNSVDSCEGRRRASPLLFFLKGDGSIASEPFSFNGLMDVIEVASIQKKCGVDFTKSYGSAAIALG